MAPSITLSEGEMARLEIAAAAVHQLRRHPLPRNLYDLAVEALDRIASHDRSRFGAKRQVQIAALVRTFYLLLKLKWLAKSRNGSLCLTSSGKTAAKRFLRQTSCASQPEPYTRGRHRVA